MTPPAVAAVKTSHPVFGSWVEVAVSLTLYVSLACAMHSAPNGRLIAIAAADRAPLCIRITTRLERSLSLVQQPMVRLAVACDQIRRDVSGLVLVDVVNRCCPAQKLSNRRLDDEDVLKHVAEPIRTRMAWALQTHVPSVENVAAAVPLRMTIAPRVVSPSIPIRLPVATRFGRLSATTFAQAHDRSVHSRKLPTFRRAREAFV